MSKSAYSIPDHNIVTGPHVCVAKAFAYQEMRYVIARLVLALDFSLAKSFDPKAFRDGIVNMRTTFLETPLLVKVQKRDGLEVDRMIL